MIFLKVFLERWLVAIGKITFPKKKSYHFTHKQSTGKNSKQSQ